MAKEGGGRGSVLGYLYSTYRCEDRCVGGGAGRGCDWLR